jgi:MerR family copper efflux transcriptional regulator
MTQRQSQQRAAGLANMMEGGGMTIGQVARRIGLSPRAVRFYEAEGVLPHAQRTVSGYRVYAEGDLELVRLVAQLRLVGLSVMDVRKVVRLREGGVPPPDRVIALLEARVSELDRDMDSLRETRGRLMEVLHRARSGIRCGSDVRLCRLVDASTTSQVSVVPDRDTPTSVT